jgi:ParB-like chromosome segregation protein Spo0J
MKIESKLVKDLNPASYNPRQISSKQYKDLKESVKKFGLVDPIIVNKDNTVIGGHQRLKVCKELKYVDVDCVMLDLSKEEERELNIRLNKNTGDFDMDILANEFDIEELTDWGFKHIDLDVNIDKIEEDKDDNYVITITEEDISTAKALYKELEGRGLKVKIKL